MLFRRISQDLRYARFVRAALAFSTASGVASVFLAALKCDLKEPWLQYGRECASLGAQWKAITAFDITSEIVLFGMSIHLVWDLQIPLPRKGKVVLAFALRLPLIIIAIIRAQYFNKQLSSADPNLSAADLSIVTQVEIAYALMATTIPCLRPFLAAFTTHLSAVGDETIFNGSYPGGSSADKSRSGGGGGSFALTSLASANHDKAGGPGVGQRFRSAAARNSREQPTGLRPGGGENIAFAGVGAPVAEQGTDASSIESRESQKMIIRKQVQWRVESDGLGEGRT